MMNRIQDPTPQRSTDHGRTRARTRRAKGTFAGWRARSGALALLVLTALTGAFLAAHGAASGNSVGTMPSLAAPPPAAATANGGRALYLEGPRSLVELAVLQASGSGTIEVVPVSGNRWRVEFHGPDLSVTLDPEVIALPSFVVGLTNSDFAVALTATVVEGMSSSVTSIDVSEDTPVPVGPWLMTGALAQDPATVHTIVLDDPVQRVKHTRTLTNGLLEITQVDV
jgi:hypothetical protein